MKRKAVAFTAFLLVALMTVSFVSCSSEPPRIEEVKDRFIYLIEESKELNTIFFGAGLPLYVRGEDLTERKGVYMTDDLAGYERISEFSEYYSAEAIKEEAKKVYSTGYLNAIYETAFDGVLVGNTGAYLRFYDDGKWFYQNINATDFGIEERIYDYSTMEMIMPSDATHINLSIDSYSLPRKIKTTVILSFVYENGNWYLDSPTY